MKFRIRNVLGVRAADVVLPEKGVALVAGKNGAGKSSLLEAARCAVLGNIKARGITTKTAAARLVYEGAEMGSATVDWGDGAQRVVWPSGEIETSGAPRDLGSPLGIGAVLWMSLKADERQREFAARFAQAPSAQDILAFLDARAEETLPADQLTDAAQDARSKLAKGLHARVTKDGWDATLKAAQEKSTKLKGAWEQVTKSRFGEAKSAKWIPAGLISDELYDPEAISAALAGARAALTKLQARGLVDDAEVERLTPLAATLAEREKDERTAQAAVHRLDTEAEKLLGESQALPPETEAPILKCPHCDGPLQVGRNANSALIVHAPTGEVPSEIELKKLAAKRAAIKLSQDTLQKDIAAATRAAQDARAAANEARQAKKRLDQIAEQAAPASTEEMAAAERKVAEIETLLAAVTTWIEAKRIYAEWVACQEPIAALLPGGVRKVVAEAALEALNDDLRKLSSAGGWAEVQLTPEMDLTLAGRPFGLLSESEQWRAEATMTLVLAQRESAAVVTLDRFDVLERSCRGPAIKALLGAGIPAIVAMTGHDRLPADQGGIFPRLKKMGAGACFWVEEGMSEELAW